MDSTPKPSRSKTKAEDVPDHGRSKRLKSEPDREALGQNGRPLHSPDISVKPEHLQKAISEEQLLELLHYSALGKAPGRLRRPSWCRLHRQKMLQAVSVAVVDHVSQRDFYEHYLSLPNLRTIYNTRLTLSSLSTNLVSEIFSSEVTVVHIPQSKPEKKLQLHKELTSHPVIAKFGTERRGLTAYLLSAEEMRKNYFPFKGRPGCESFVCTDTDLVVTDSSPLFGLDCEMCHTTHGRELTRVCLVDSSGACLLDQLVKPLNRICNYLTQFSGVTAEMLSPVRTTLSEVQARLKSLLPRDAVLVGHSLENDLIALKMIHPHVIDSSLLYRRANYGRFKLKVLAETLLQKQIQTDDSRGHDPCEDATAALELVQYFISIGPFKIVEEHLEELWGITLTEQEEPTPLLSAELTSSRFSDVLQACGHSAAFFGKRSDIGLHLSKQQWLRSDRQVLQAFREQPKCPSFSVLQFCFGQAGGAHAVARTQACAPLRDLCVLFAGPLPPQSSADDVRDLFCCCGPLRSVRIIRTALRVHAELHFELAESALLALSALNGLPLLGHVIKVQRPVSEATLDVDATLEALQSDPVTSRLLYVTSISPGLAPLLQNSTVTSLENPVQVNGQRGLTEDSLLDLFSRFGPVLRIIRPMHTGAATHAYVEFASADSRWAALDASQDLLQLHYLLCPALMPLHLSAPVSADPAEEPEDRTEDTHKTCLVAAQRLKKLDRRLGKLFRHLPKGTLSVVVLRGSHHTPGLCFVEVKTEH